MASHSQTFLLMTFLPIAMMILMASRPSQAAGSCNQNDQDSLLLLKAYLGDPKVLSSWLVSNDCCTSWEGVTCNTNNRVNAVRISNSNDANGYLPDELGNLDSLVVLSLVRLPNLGGELPSTITQLTNLVRLEISHTKLSGQVPANLGKLTKLQFVILSYNDLSGSIPDSLDPLTNLLSLHLSHNQLSGPIPDSLGNLPYLQDINLDQNQLTGELPAAFPEKLTILSLAGNKLDGSIPESVANLNLARVDLSENRFVGDASVLFGEEKQTKVLNISRNQFSFNLSSVEFPPNLTVLDISFNNIFSTIPSQVADLGSLQSFNVRNNLLWGEIPSIVSNFETSVFDENTCLCGHPLQQECPCCFPTSSENPTGSKIRKFSKIRRF